MTKKFFGLSAVAASLVVAGVAAVGTPAMADGYTYKIGNGVVVTQTGNLNAGLNTGGAVVNAWAAAATPTTLAIKLTGNQTASTVLGTTPKESLYLFDGTTSQNLAGLTNLAIDGGGFSLGKTGSTDARILAVYGTSSTADSVTLNNITATGGVYTTAIVTTIAGGVNFISDMKTVSIDNSKFSSNTLKNITTGTFGGYGGGLYILGESGAVITITNTQFTDNKIETVGATSGGGLMVRTAASFIFTDSVVSGNTVTSSGTAAGASGAGMRLDPITGTISVERVVFSDNKATATGSNTDAFGGAIRIEPCAATITFTDVTFTDNQAKGTRASGGAIYSGAVLTIKAVDKDVVFSGNSTHNDVHGLRGNDIHSSQQITFDAAAGRVISLDGGITGAASVVKDGLGKLVFDDNATTNGGKYSYTGATTINAGTLEVIGLLGDGNSYAKTITNNGTLHMNQSQNQTLSGVISGNGSLIKSDSGTLTLSGANTYTGNTTINAGKLSLSNTGTLAIVNGSTLTVTAEKTQTNAPITGTGTLTVASGGKVAVHAKAVQLDALVAGTVTNFYFADSTTFASFTVPQASVDHSSISTLLYDTAYIANAKNLAITRKSGSAIPIVSHSVGDAVASYTGVGGRNDLIDDVRVNSNGDQHSDAERLEMGYNAASGVGAAQQGAAALGGVYGVMDSVVSGNFSGGGGGVYRGQSPCDPCAPACGRSRLERAVWVMPIYGHQDAKGLHSGDVKYGYTSDQYAAVFGAEVKSGHTRFGIAGNAGVGRAVSHLAVSNVHTNSDLTYGGVSLYAVRKFGRVESNTQVGWIGTKNEMRQNNAGTRVAADIKGGVIYAALGFERPYHYGNLTLAPIFGLEFTHLYQNGFATRVGGTAQFNAQSGNANMLHLPLGLKASANYKTRYGQWSPMVKARVLPHVGDHELAFSNLATGSTVAATLHGVVSDAVAGDVTFGSTLKRGRTELGGAYTVLFSEHFTNQNVSVLLKRTF